MAKTDEEGDAMKAPTSTAATASPPSSPAPSAAAGKNAAPPKTPFTDLEAAWAEYGHAVQEAWQRAAKEASLANLQAHIGRQQIVSQTRHRQIAAGEEWAKSVHGIDAASPDAASAVAEAAEAYQDGLRAAEKSGGAEWQASFTAQHAALAAIGEAYRTTIKGAYENYLARLKTAWGAVDPASICPGGLARLAQATGWAASASAFVAQK